MTDQDSDFIDLKEILSIIRRQARLIVLTVIIALAIAFFHLTQATSQYTATTLLMVDPQGKNVLDLETGTTSSQADNARLESEVEILKSDSLALTTIQTQELYLTDEYGPSFGITDKLRAALGMDVNELPTGEDLMQSTLGKFNDSLSVRRRGLTYLIAVSATSESPQRAADIANAHAQNYIAQQVTSKVDSSLSARDVIQNQLAQARATLASTDGALEAYIDQNLSRLESEIGSDRISQLRGDLTAMNQQLDMARASQTAARQALANQNYDELAQQVGDAALARLNQQREALQRRLAGTEAGTAEAIDLASGLAQIEDQLQSQAQAAVSDLDNSIRSYQDEGTTIRGAIRDEVLASNLSPETLAEIYSLQQEAQIAQRQYDTLLSRMRDIETQALVQIADSRIVSEALPPRNASFPNKKLELALALVAGLGIGIAIAFANEYFFGGVVSASQLANIIPLRVAAVIPKVQQGTNELSVADRLVDEPMSMIAESFRRLRATIDLQVPDKPGEGKVIMVTSSIPAEGKSTDALSLARTYAIAGKRTLLIDGDLRKPSQHKLIGAEPQHGLLEYLIDGNSSEHSTGEFYDADPKTPLGIMMGKRRSNVPTDAPLQSAAFEELIKNARKALDVIIIDTAPLVPVVDARYIAPMADAVVVCVRYGVTNQSDLRTCYEQLTDSVRQGTAMVSVLNCHEGQEKSYRYTGYYS
ncbi:GumC family protein [Marivivens aquimaris]|uniref:GumC family protein n=1 Tax=Marivivens aquimaris TaxID=2774876 RepID=UPI0018809B1D|nr:polysaccharide biosynthesis tyrosine autokinase [Marivivens aquimaris]